MDTSRLVQEIAGFCRSRMLAEKWLIAPSRRVGNQWAECVARSGQAAVNLRVKTLKSLATELAGREMLARKVKLVSEQAGPLLIDQVFRRLKKAGLGYLGTLPASAGLAETMFRSIQDIRLAGLAPDQIVPRRFEVSAKGQDLLQIIQRLPRRPEGARVCRLRGRPPARHRQGANAPPTKILSSSAPPAFG